MRMATTDLFKRCRDGNDGQCRTVTTDPTLRVSQHRIFRATWDPSKRNHRGKRCTSKRIKKSTDFKA